MDRSKYPPLVMLDNYWILPTGEKRGPWTVWECECGKANGDTSRCKRCRRIFNLKEARAELRRPPKPGGR